MTGTRGRSPRQESTDPTAGSEVVEKTARNSRRLLPTGTVGEYKAMLPPQPANARPMTGPAMPVADATAAPQEYPHRIYQRITDKDVLTARRMMRESGIVTFLDDMVQAKKVSVGPHVRVTVEALLVAMWLAANTNRPMLLTEFRDILFHCITPPMRKMLNVRDGRVARSTVPSKFRKWNKTSAKAVGETFRRMSAVIDPSDEITQRKQVTWEQMKFRGLTDEQMTALQALLDWVCAQVVLVTYQTLPESVRRFDHGDRCIDGTGVPMFTRSRGLDHPEAMSMPHGGNYVRDGDHGEPGEASTPKSNKKTGSSKGAANKRRAKPKFYPGLELHLLTASDTTPGDKQRFPNGLVTSMTTDRPSLNPAGAARRLIALESHLGYPIGFFTGDGLYAKAEETSFQIPARQAGYKVILPVLPTASGVQGAHASGFPWVDGTGYCPAMTDHLRTIVDDLREKRIDLKTFGDKIRARKKFELVTKQKPDERGMGERVGCRAANHSMTVKCGHKPESMKERKTLDRDGNLADNRPVIVTAADAAAATEPPPSICSKQAVTLKETDAAKFRQAIPIGDEHTDTYNGLRNPHEGMNGFAKDEAFEALAVAGRRRVRTKVAQQLFLAFLCAASNLRKIRSFLERAEIDDNGDYYVTRATRTGSHARTGLPPGTPLHVVHPPPDAPAA